MCLYHHIVLFFSTRVFVLLRWLVKDEMVKTQRTKCVIKTGATLFLYFFYIFSLTHIELELDIVNIRVNARTCQKILPYSS